MMKPYFINYLTLKLLGAIMLLSVITPQLTEAQTLTAKVHRLHTNIGGYYESLPVDYGSSGTKKYPLLIFMHGSNALGTGSLAHLPRILNDTISVIPRRIQAGTFPAEFTVNGKKHSFIVIAPQYEVYSLDSSQIKAVIDSCTQLYRVDTSRIYLTGSITGGRIAWFHAAASAAMADRLAAIMLASPAMQDPLAVYGPRVGNSNLPVWFTGNYGDATTSGPTSLLLAKNHINSVSPNPLAKLTIWDTAMLKGRDSYTRAYDPNNREEGLSAFEWMLQYTNNRLSPDAGPDQGFTKPASGTKTITLDGSKSLARAGDITGYSWSKISGKSGTTITSPSNATTTVTGLTDSTYLFALTVTHTNGSTASDTVKVSTQTFQKFANQNVDPQINGYLEALPTDFYNDPNKRHPLLVFLHGIGKLGNGTSGTKTPLTGLELLLEEGGIPALIKDGKFPEKFVSEGQSYSFIIEAPQIKQGGYDTIRGNAVNQFVSAILAKYPGRIDTSRIYITGLSMGGGIIKRFTGMYSERIAATVITAGSSLYNTVTDTVGYPALHSAANLPYWATHNEADSTVKSLVSKRWIPKINSFTPKANPPAKLTIFPVASHNSWSTTYDTSFKENGLDIYRWMLQFTNERLVAKAGSDRSITLPISSLVLDGTKSMARGNPGLPGSLVYNRVNSYNWNKISGPSATIDTASKANPTVSGLSAGVYQFELTVTHTDGVTVKKDTVQVTVNAASPRQAGPEEKLQLTDESKEFLDLKLNPNPVRSNLTVFVSGKATGTASLALYNLQGQKLSQQQFNKPSAQTVARNVQVSNLPSGAYAIQVVLEGKTKTIQFIKE